MPQEHQRRLLVAAELARRTREADAREIALVVTQAIGAIETALVPLIGKGGVVALYRRSLFLASSVYPWLAASDSSRSQIALASLRDLLSQRDPALAREAGGSLLQTVCDLLSSLVGSSLSERLLRNLWSDT